MHRLTLAWRKYVHSVQLKVLLVALEKVQELRKRSRSQRKAFKFVRFIYGVEERKLVSRCTRLSLRRCFKALQLSAQISVERESKRIELKNCNARYHAIIERSNARARALYQLELIARRVHKKKCHFYWWKGNTMWNTLLAKVSISQISNAYITLSM